MHDTKTYDTMRHFYVHAKAGLASASYVAYGTKTDKYGILKSICSEEKVRVIIWGDSPEKKI